MAGYAVACQAPERSGRDEGFQRAQAETAGQKVCREPRGMAVGIGKDSAQGAQTRAQLF